MKLMIIYSRRIWVLGKPAMVSTYWRCGKRDWIDLILPTSRKKKKSHVLLNNNFICCYHECLLSVMLCALTPLKCSFMSSAHACSGVHTTSLLPNSKSDWLKHSMYSQFPWPLIGQVIDLREVMWFAKHMCQSEWNWRYLLWYWSNEELLLPLLPWKSSALEFHCYPRGSKTSKIMETNN